MRSTRLSEKALDNSSQGLRLPRIRVGTSPSTVQRRTTRL